MPEQPVSRVLFLKPKRNQAMAIHLGRLLPDASSNLPGSIGRAALKRFPIWSCTGWGLPSSRCRHRDWWALTSPFHPYPEKFRWIFQGGLLSVALSLGLPPVAVSDHPALWCSDFPPEEGILRRPFSLLRHDV